MLVERMSDQWAFPLYLAKCSQRSISKGNNRFYVSTRARTFFFFSDTFPARSCNLCMIVASIGLDPFTPLLTILKLGRGGIRKKKMR